MDKRIHEKKGRRLIIISIALSVLLHILVLYLSRFAPDGPERSTPLKVKIYENQHDKKMAKAAKKNPMEKPKKDEKLEGQIVDIAKPKNETQPDKYKFLAKYNSTVDKESKAKFDKNIPILGSKLNQQLNLERNKTIITEDKALSSGNKENQFAEKQEIKKGAPEVSKNNKGVADSIKPKDEPGSSAGTNDHDKVGAKETGKTLPSKYLPYFIGGDNSLSSPSNDYLKDISSGDETQLNARQYIYADYYNRIKKAVSYYWTPAKILLVNDPRGNIYGYKDRYTKLEAILDKRGNIIEVKIAKASGVDFLDMEALNAFKMAAPFPNPPAPLLENDRLKIPLGFYVEMDR